MYLLTKRHYKNVHTLYEFPIAAVTNAHKQKLETTQIYSLTVLEVPSLKPGLVELTEGAVRGVAPGSRLEGPSPCFLSNHRMPALLSLWYFFDNDNDFCVCCYISYLNADPPVSLL